MQFVKKVGKELDSICIYSKQIIIFSFWSAVVLFVLALISYRMAFYLDYHQQMLIHRTAMEAAPSCFVAGFIAALIGDLAARSYEKKNR
ncbi:MAG: hypothetical protein PHE47_00355 [Oscillospiraceae bacterium]|nr:hypothetical protein [Oscillospiraceae bacterium]